MTAGVLFAGIGFEITVHTGTSKESISENIANADNKTTAAIEEVPKPPQVDIHIGHVNVTGLSPEEMKDKLDKEFKWNLSVSDGEKSVPVKNLIRPQRNQESLEQELNHAIIQGVFQSETKVEFTKAVPSRTPVYGKGETSGNRYF